MKQLFKSQTTFEVLNLLCQDAEKYFYLNEMAKDLHKDPSNLAKELGRLVEDGFVQIREDKGKKYYSFNETAPAAKEWQALFQKDQEADLEKRFKTTWLLAEDIPNMDPFFSFMWTHAFVRYFHRAGGKAYKKIVGVYRDYHLWFYFDEQDASEVAKHLVDRFVGEPSFMKEVNDQIIKKSDHLRNLVNSFPQEQLEKYSNKELWDFYKKQNTSHTEYYDWAWIPVAADMFGNQLTEKGKALLRTKGVEEEKINQTLTLLTQPTDPSLLKQEQDHLAAMGILVQEDSQQQALFQELFQKFKEEDVKQFGLYTHSPQYEEKFEQRVRELEAQIRPDILKELQAHYTTYFYSKFLFTEEQGVYTFAHYLKELVRLVNRHPQLKQEQEEDQKHIAQMKKEKAQMIAHLKLTGEQKDFFHQWGMFMVTKIYRRFAQIYALYRMIPILEEIAKRLCLSLKETKFLLPEEIRLALIESIFPEEGLSKKRIPLSLYYVDQKEEVFFHGKMVEKILPFIENTIDESVYELQGQCGCQGVAEGIVRRIDTMEDMKKMQQGDILVSICTQPDLIPAMKKAAGFVTDQGGVTSHAAIVAREMHTPCVIGTKIASKVLKDGMRVRVDANKGIVTVLEK